MNNYAKAKTKKWYLTYFLTCVLKTTFILFLAGTQIYAQEETKPGSFGIHLGINNGLLIWGGTGPSFSIHYALRTEKVLQPESMLYFDYQSGWNLFRRQMETFGYGLAAGIRINFFMPKKNWNPSCVIMPGVIYSSRTVAPDPTGFSGYRRNGISVNICSAYSITFYRKHMGSIGLNYGHNIIVVYLKYGFWF